MSLMIATMCFLCTVMYLFLADYEIALAHFIGFLGWALVWADED